MSDRERMVAELGLDVVLAMAREGQNGTLAVVAIKERAGGR